MKKDSEKPPIKVSRQFYWHDLDNLKIPHELRILLRGLIGAFLSSSIMPEATRPEIDWAKEYLSEGIQIEDRRYSVMIFVPNNIETHRAFFALVPMWPKGILKRLDEI